MAEKKRTIAPWIALGTVFGVAAAWGGFGLLGAVTTSAPSTITTCTNAKTGKTKVTAVCKVGKGFAKTWDSRYVDLLRRNPDVGSNDFRGLNFSNMTWTGANLYQGNFAGDNFTNAVLTDGQMFQSDFAGANFTNAYLFHADTAGSNFLGTVWNNTVCPDGTNSNADAGSSCNGHF